MLAEIDDLLARIRIIDPLPSGGGSHDTQFWPAMLGPLAVVIAPTSLWTRHVGPNTATRMR
jgi:hypothetical protein